MTNIQHKLEETVGLFDAVQTAGNEAMRKVGFNVPYDITSNISAIYELFESGPEHLYHGQYNNYTYGAMVDPTKEGLDEHELFMRMQNIYRRITIYYKDLLVFRIEGKGSFRMSQNSNGPWEEEIISWFKDNGGVLR